jgi:hypothetical protein
LKLNQCERRYGKKFSRLYRGNCIHLRKRIEMENGARPKKIPAGISICDVSCASGGNKIACDKKSLGEQSRKI